MDTYTRLIQLTLPQLAIFGPAATTLYKVMQRRVVFPGRPNTEILARVGIDQLAFAPTNLFFFLSSMALMEGSDPKKKLDSTYVTAITKNWTIWPWVQLVNFKFVPLEHRVLVVNFISIGMLCCLQVRLNGLGVV